MSAEKRSFFLTAFGAHIPSAPKVLQEQNLYPVAIRTHDGFDLDASSLLVADQLILDSTALEHIQSRSKVHLDPMAQTVNALIEQDLIDIKDYSKIASRNKDLIISSTNALIEDPAIWISHVRQHWNTYSKEIPELLSRYKKHLEIDIQKENMHFGVYCFLHNNPQGGRDIKAIEAILHSRKKRFSNMELQLLKEIIKPLVEYVVLNQILSRELSSAFVDWSDLGPLYQKSLALALNDSALQAQKTIDGCRQLFSIAMPELMPTSSKQLVHFLKSSHAVGSLRQAISNAIATGTMLDEKWAVELRNEANRMQLASRKRQRVFSFIGSLLSLIPGGGLIAPGFIGEALFSIGLDSCFEVESARSERKSINHLKWYFTLLEAKA